MSTWLVTGASRGIGLGFVTHLAEMHPHAKVIATCRDPDRATELQELVKKNGDRVSLVRLDVADEGSVQAAVAEVATKAPQGIDILINNAGVQDPSGFVDVFETKVEDFGLVLRNNVVGYFLTTKYFVPLLRKGEKKIVVNISSNLGSCGLLCQAITDPSKRMPMDYKYVAYKSSKAAINMDTLIWAHALREDGFTVLAIAPGWVATDMGNYTKEKLDNQSEPEVSVDESVSAMLKLIKGIEPKKDNGKFLNYTGDILPW